MVRSLARFYYYLVFIAMLDLAAAGLGYLLATALRYTPLGDGNPPASREITQALSFFGVAWLIAGVLGGVHYWLIRRDIATDAGAGEGGVRSFFLNATEFVAGWVGVGVGAAAVTLIGLRLIEPSGLGPDYSYSYSSSLAIAFTSIAIPALLIVALLEAERRRTTAGPGAPIIFQRLHFYALQLVILLFYAIGAVSYAISQTIAQALTSAGLYDPCGPNPDSFGGSSCSVQVQFNLLGLWGAALFTLLALGAYVLLFRRDPGSTLRQVGQLIGLAIGASYVAVGAGLALDLALHSILGDPFTWQTFVTRYDFAGPLLAGLLVAAAYVLWLRREGPTSRMGVPTTGLSIQAVAAVVFAAPFWFGVGWLIFRILEVLTNSNFRNHALDWSSPLAVALAGAIYLPITLLLRRQTQASGVQGPRRAFVLAMLAGGTIAGAIGGAIALFSGVTAALGVPVDTSGEAGRGGSAALLTGAILAGVYLWSAVSERLLRRGAPQPSPAAPTPSVPLPGGGTVEGVLDDLLAGRVTREAAAGRIRELVRAGR